MGPTRPARRTRGLCCGRARGKARQRRRSARNASERAPRCTAASNQPVATRHLLTHWNHKPTYNTRRRSEARGRRARPGAPPRLRRPSAAPPAIPRSLQPRRRRGDFGDAESRRGRGRHSGRGRKMRLSIASNAAVYSIECGCLWHRMRLSIASNAAVYGIEWRVRGFGAIACAHKLLVAVAVLLVVHRVDRPCAVPPRMTCAHRHGASARAHTGTPGLKPHTPTHEDTHTNTHERAHARKHAHRDAPAAWSALYGLSSKCAALGRVLEHRPQ